MAKLTNEDAQDCIRNPIDQILAGVGITPELLAKQLKRELKAKETKFIKVKRNDQADEIVKQITDLAGGNGKKQRKKYTEIVKTTEEKVIAVNVKALGIQQRAREDAQKLLGLYPAEKKELTGADGKQLVVEIVSYADPT